MNGGPGCTSLKGGFEELGQLVFNRHSFTENKTLAPKMYYNPVGWTRKSTMLYFESPPGVGFSYCDVCVGNATCNCVATDVSTAEDNYDALVSFFNNFPVRLVAFHPPLHSRGAQLARDRALARGWPSGLLLQEFKDSEFYITGESYAGQYPTLMDQIRTKGGVNLKGAAVGNGVGGGPTARGDRIRTK
jgi:serine carboxypeptidase-like clade II